MMLRIFIGKLALLLLCALFISSLSGPVAATPLNTWRISCGVDTGSIERQSRTWIFRTSSNRCPGGIFTQRAEISTDKIPPNHQGAYIFESKVSFRSTHNEVFDIFQIHDGRLGCAPPLKLEVLQSGRLSLVSEHKIGSEPGNNCAHNAPMSAGQSRVALRRDGTEYKLTIVIDFDGTGAFSVWVAVDDAPQLHGRYEYVDGRGFFRSEFFYFKHGVYSRNVFPYEMRSRDMRVRRVQLAN